MPGCPLDGMCLERGLPEAMSDETVATIVATTATVAPNALDITKGFYGEVIESLPSVVLTLFNPANNVPISTIQPAALAAAVCAYATNIKDLSPLLVPGGAKQVASIGPLGGLAETGHGIAIGPRCGAGRGKKHPNHP